MRSKLINKLLNKAGYVRKGVALKKVLEFKDLYEEQLDKNTILEIQVANMAEELIELRKINKELLIEKKAAEKKLSLAQRLMSAYNQGGRK